MNPEMNTPEPIEPSEPSEPSEPIEAPEHTARRNTTLGLVAVVMGLILTTILFAPPRRKPVKGPVAGSPEAVAAMPSGCTRNLAAAPTTEPAPQSGCGHCDSASASLASKENCDMHKAPSKPLAADAQAKPAGAPHE